MEYKQLEKNQYVIFTDIDGSTFKEGYLECRGWSTKHNAFYSFSRATEENVKIYSNVVETKAPRKARKASAPTSAAGMVEINPCGETAKAYQICIGDNGLVGKKQRAFYEFVAKSICFVDEDGRIYAPIWACRW